MHSEQSDPDDLPLYGGVRLAGDVLGTADIPQGASVLHVVLIRLRRLLEKEQAATLARAGGLSISEWRILHLLASIGPMAQTDLVKRVVIEQAQASRVIRAMQLAEIITVTRDLADRRRWICALSERGDEIYRVAQPVMQARREYFDSTLSAEERAQFLDYANRIAGRALSVLDGMDANQMKAGTNLAGDDDTANPKGRPRK
jgi:DNA-binding MarR family transcriptional regulator